MSQWHLDVIIDHWCFSAFFIKIFGHSYADEVQVSVARVHARQVLEFIWRLRHLCRLEARRCRRPPCDRSQRQMPPPLRGKPTPKLVLD